MDWNNQWSNYFANMLGGTQGFTNQSYGMQDFSGGFSNPAYNWMQPFQNDSSKSQKSRLSFPNDNMKVTLSWKVSAYAPEKLNIIDKIRDKIWGPPDADDTLTPILKNISGVFKPGELVAIMGASGAGKTTLLNILSFRNKSKMRIDKDVRVNGKPVDLEEIAEYSGYVQQNDVFIGTMTVREWLTFQAHLRLGRNFTKEDKYERVDEIIQQCNLIKAQDNFIGMGDKMKGISGGEKRRLAFATEIITNPPLLFCDEPTSGLDAYMAVGLVEIMAEQAKLGKTIVCTIHQPSTQIFEKFNTLCLLSEGRIAYSGPRTEALQFFGNLGYQCPKDYNPADYYIQKLAILPNSREESLVRANKICDAFEQSQYNSNIQQSISQIHNSFDPSMDSGYKRRYNASYMEQFRWLLWRNFLNDIRTPIATKVLAGQTIFIGLFFGLIYLQLKVDETGVTNTNGLLFILMMNVGFIYLFPILNVFTSEMPVFYRDFKNKLYSTWVYYISKQIAEFPKYLVLSFALVTIIYWLANVRNDGEIYISITLIFLLSSQVAMSFGYFLSVLSGNVEFATSIAAPILIPLILFAGFFLNNSSTPVYFIWIKYISWFYYTFDAIMIKLWSSYKTVPCTTPILPNTCPNPRCFADGKAVLKAYGVSEGDLARDIIIMIAIAVALRFFGYLILRFRASRI